MGNTTREYFGLGHRENGESQWYFRAYDKTPEGRFDVEGCILGASRHSAFGKKISDVGNVLNQVAFQGQYFDEDANHYNMGARNLCADDGHWF